MKKRVLSILLVLVMLFSLVPTAAFAADDYSITITRQPNNAFIRSGGSATFSIEATSTKGVLKYLWVDTDKLNIDNISSLSTKITNILTDSSIATNIEEGILGTSSEITVNNVTKEINVQCLLYITETGKIIPIPIIKALAASDKVTITFDTTPICTSHQVGVNLAKTSRVEADCSHAGNIEYYECLVCGECFKDEYGQQRISKDAVEIPKTDNHRLGHYDPVPGNCDERGTPEYWMCSVCNHYFLDANGNSPITYLQLQLRGEKDPNRHLNVIHVAEREGTCDEKGNIEYWKCEDCNTYFKDAELTMTFRDRDDVETAKNPYNHGNMIYHPYVAPTCDREGNKAYYECTECHEYFEDEEGIIKTSKAKVELDATRHNYIWDFGESGGFEYHMQVCTICGDVKSNEVHTGGTASCTKKAVCVICGREYGTIDPSNHVNTVVQGEIKATVEREGYSGDTFCYDCNKVIKTGEITPKLCIHTVAGSGVLHKFAATEATCTEILGARSGNIEYWSCDACGKYWSDAELKNEISFNDTVVGMMPHYVTNYDGSKSFNPKLAEVKFDETHHWTECKCCGAVYEGTKSVHRMTTQAPTCCGSNHCVDCNYSDGITNPKNHSGGTLIIGAYDPDGKYPGYTGDVQCAGCKQIIEHGKYYFNGRCPDGCASTLEFVKGQTKTCSDDGIKDHYKCTMCGSLYHDEFGATPATEKELVDPCSGHDIHPSFKDLEDLVSVEGLKKVLLSNGFIGNILDLLSGGTPSFEQMLEKITIGDLDHCYDDTYHWLGCQTCGKTLKELAPELAEYDLSVNTKLMEMSVKQYHTGGTATCQEKAKCTECGEYYGQIAPHDYYENNICKTCNTKGVACAAPKVTSSKSTSTGVVTLRWNEVKNASTYEVWTAATKNGTYTCVYSGEAVSYKLTQSGYGKPCYAMVRAIGTDGSFGKFTAKMTFSGKCPAPTLKASNVASSGKIKLSWNKITGASKYELYRATSKSGTYKLIKSTTSTSFTNTTPTAGTTYYYKVRAVGKDGAKGTFSSIVSRCCDCARPVVKVKNNTTTGKIVVSWNDITGASKYEVWRATSKTGTYKKISTTTNLSLTNTSAKAGTLYYYKVKAISAKKSAGDSAFSEVVSRRCDCAKPSARIGLNYNHPYVKWDPVDGADKYIVYRSTSSNGTYTKMITTTKTDYTNTKATPYYRYYYKVVAVSNKSTAANSAYSNIVTIVAR